MIYRGWEPYNITYTIHDRRQQWIIKETYRDYKTDEIVRERVGYYVDGKFIII